jgi:hypothetical protein
MACSRAFFCMNQIFFKSSRFRIVLFLIISVLFAIVNSNKFFFWDTITLVSAPANFYYDNNFRYFFLPDSISTSHPPLAGLYMALIWKIFGKSLLVSHLGMAPFVFGILCQSYRYVERSGQKMNIVYLILLLWMLDATLISQMSMISSDLLLVFFFLWCLNSIKDRHTFSLFVSFLLLCLVSNRGPICGFGLILFYLLNMYISGKEIRFKSIVPFLPGIAITILWITLFYLNKHWFYSNSDPNRWQESLKLAGFTKILFNILVLIWRMLDFGRIGIWLIFTLILIKSIKDRCMFDDFFKETFLIGFTQFLVFSPILIFIDNLYIGHRYLLPLLFCVAVCSGYWIFMYSKFPKLLYAFLLGILISGWFWVYPVKIAQGWDATPAHWPYYDLRREMIHYLDSADIPISEVGSFFPNLSSSRLIDLSEKNISFKEADLYRDNYILFANVYNLPDDKIADLYSVNKWQKEKVIKKGGVLMILFQRK